MAPGEARVLRGRRARETVLVVVRPGCVLELEGRTYGEGELLALSRDKLHRLEQRGTVLRRD